MAPKSKLIDPDNLSYWELELKEEDLAVFNHDFTGLIWFIRMFVIFRWNKEPSIIRIKDIPVVKRDDDRSKNLLLIKVKYTGDEIKFILEKHTLYVVAFTGGGIWRILKEFDYKIKGAVDVYIDSKYPSGTVHEVGFDAIVGCIRALQSSDHRDWKNAYYKLAANFSEPARFHTIHRFILSLGEIGSRGDVLSGFENFLTNFWSKLSKAVKLFARYGVFDFLGQIPLDMKGEGGLLQNVGQVKHVLAIMLDVEMELEIRKIEDASSGRARVPINNKIH